MKKTVLILALICSSIALKMHAVVLNFKGGAANTVDIALFKKKGKFEDYLEKSGVSKDIANKVEKFTKDNSEYIGGAIGGFAGTLVSGAISVTATPAIGAASATIIIPVFTKAGQFGFENYGRAAQLGAGLVNSVSKKLYASHYFDKVTAPQTLCLGLTGNKNRLIRSKEVIKDDKLMELNNVQPMYLVIFNHNTVENKKDLEFIRDLATGAAVTAKPHIYARPGDILYAGELSPHDLQSSLDITTYFIKEEAFDEDETPILDLHGKPLVLKRTVGVKITPIDPTGGLECK